MNVLIRLGITTILVFVLSSFFDTIHVTDFITALLVAVVLGVLNTFLKPILVFLTIPFTIITLGLFLLVINASIILLSSRFVDGFQVDGFWPALWFSILLSICQSILNKIFIDKK